MAITSVCFYVVARTHFGWSRAVAGVVLLFFLSMDVPFFIANLFKFLDGGYVPILIGAAFVVIMGCWRRGRGLLADVTAARSRPVEEFIRSLDTQVRARLPGVAAVMGATATGVPAALVRIVEELHVVHETVLLVTVTSEHVPEVSDTERIEATPLGAGLFRVVLHYGFMERPNVPAALGEALQKLALPADLARVTYVIGRETVLDAGGGKMGPIAEGIFGFLARNARNVTDYFGLPHQQVLEIGSRVDL
jgi:KUP system potassium uptake protein